MNKKFMTSIVVILALLLGTVAGLAATREIAVKVDSETGKPVPVVFTLDELRRAFGITFRADWDTLEAFDQAGEPLPVQVDDVDGDGNYTRDDIVTVAATGDITLAVSTSGEAKTYPDQFTIEETDDGKILISSVDGQFAVQVDSLGVLEVVKFNGMPSSYIHNIGVLRYAGYPTSTYWVDGDLKGHEEKTTYEEPQRVYDLRVLADSPVRATVIVQRVSDLFPGLTQSQLIGIYPWGDITVDTVVESRGYADMTKLLTVSSGFMAGARDATHILPVFSAMEWADELEITPSEYWAERDALIEVDNSDYVAFKGSGPAPFWWGASYIFASPERWRTNHSEELGIGAAEMLLTVPEIADDPIERLSGLQWQYEGEWRYGYFRWIPDEVVTKRAERGVELDLDIDMESGDWPLHMIPGDTFSVRNVYTIYEAETAADAVRFLEVRHNELSSVTMEP